MKFHPLADIFPMIDGEAFDQLVADIKEHGLNNPITLYEDMVLDGRNRFKACGVAGVEPDFDDYEGNTPLAFVISQNIERRHLNENQRALIAARIATMKQGARTDLAPIGAMSQFQAAVKLNVGRRSVQRATVVLEKARPSVVKAIDDGRLSVTRAEEIAELTPEDQDMLSSLPADDIVQVHDKLKRDTRREAFFKSTGVAAFEEGKWNVFVADPAWLDEFGASARAIENHYGTMPTDQITNLDVAGITAEHGVLFLWALPHMLQQALDVMKAWGFSYRTHMIWEKDKIGLGKWVRNEHELLLIGRKGAWPPPVEELRVGSVIRAPVGEHSEKPEIFLEMIERWYPDAPKIELFRRGKAREGWSAWGNEVERETAAE